MKIKEKLIKKTIEWFEKFEYEYDKDIVVECWDKKEEILRDAETIKEVYIVSFKFEDYIEYDKNGDIEHYGEGHYAFAYYDAETLKLMYILNHHSYIEPDGTY